MHDQGADLPEPSPARERASGLARELTGDLPCVRCRYNLRGLSVRSECPECGSPIRATILAVVDPRADELRPVITPRITAIGLILWSTGALAAALTLWYVRLSEVTAEMWSAPLPRASADTIALAATACSGVGALALVIPMRDIPRASALRALVGVIAYLPLLWALWSILFGIDRMYTEPYFHPSIEAVTRSGYRLIAGASMLAIIVGLRPNARALAARSVLMRTGRIDRQTMLAIATAVCIAMVGDIIHIIAPVANDIARVVGTVAIAVGSMFITLGLAGAVVDTLRLRRVVAHKVQSLDDLTGGDAP